MVAKNCGTCQHCMAIPDQTEKGMCRRFPPQPFPIIQTSQGVIGSKEQYRVPMVMSYNPPVRFEDAACGEWEAYDDEKN